MPPVCPVINNYSWINSTSILLPIVYFWVNNRISCCNLVPLILSWVTKWVSHTLLCMIPIKVKLFVSSFWAILIYYTLAICVNFLNVEPPQMFSNRKLIVYVIKTFLSQVFIDDISTSLFFITRLNSTIFASTITISF